MSITLTITIAIGLLSLTGMGCILYSLIYEKDFIPIKYRKPPEYYPQKSKDDEENNTVIFDL